VYGTEDRVAMSFGMWKRIRRRVSAGNGLHFDYEVSPHRAFLAKTAKKPEGANIDASKIGDYVPFKQSRLIGQTNPLRPPLHVETVLIGRALRQPTGYLFGVGFRVRDDGYIEAEFAGGVRKFDTYEKFEIEVTPILLGAR
jgi:hypothetical protein